MCSSWFYFFCSCLIWLSCLLAAYLAANCSSCCFMHCSCWPMMSCRICIFVLAYYSYCEISDIDCLLDFSTRISASWSSCSFMVASFCWICSLWCISIILACSSCLLSSWIFWVNWSWVSGCCLVASSSALTWRSYWVVCCSCNELELELWVACSNCSWVFCNYVFTFNSCYCDTASLYLWSLSYC